jgi:hypothetical protein
MILPWRAPEAAVPTKQPFAERPGGYELEITVGPRLWNVAIPVYKVFL